MQLNSLSLGLWQYVVLSLSPGSLLEDGLLPTMLRCFFPPGSCRKDHAGTQERAETVTLCPYEGEDQLRELQYIEAFPEATKAAWYFRTFVLCPE